MRGLYLCLFLTGSLLLAGCGGQDGDPKIPVQDFSAGQQLGGGPSGLLHGAIRFPSEYSQRSLSFTVDGRKFVSQPDGRFSLDKLPVGDHRLRVVVKGYEPVEYTFGVREDESTLLEPTRLKVARGRVVGRLVNNSGNSAIDVVVQLSPKGGVARTDNDGIFEFIAVHMGDYKLRIADPKFFTYDRTISMNSGESRNLGNIKVHARAQLPVQSTARMPDK